jgi:hypothetical protein
MASAAWLLLHGFCCMASAAWLLLHGFFSRPNPVNKLPQIGAPFGAGYTPGIARGTVAADPRLLSDCPRCGSVGRCRRAALM